MATRLAAREKIVVTKGIPHDYRLFRLLTHGKAVWVMAICGAPTAIQ